MKVLVIEDEQLLLQNILSYLAKENYICDSADNFNSAFEKIAFNDYDCYVVDIMLGDYNGLTLIENLKKANKEGGVIIISAKNSLDDRLNGLNIGADDYLTKPFHLSELNARIKAILRRRQNKGFKNLVFNEILIDLDSQDTFVNDVKLELTTKEFQLLKYFVINKNRVIKKQSIVDHLWSDEYNFSSYDFIYTHLTNLRKKLSNSGCKDYIRTIYGLGYKFSESE
ncbi:MAG: response regulator transcription factor [Bacteroidales bacterium]|nr:response regulator transcription factor [Bacteroidales bacterium]